jgi:superoxide dismutase, Fe-Mn family
MTSSTHHQEVAMFHQLPPLPFALDALAPAISRETLEFHHDKHHRGYVDKTNELVNGTAFEKMPLEELVTRSAQPNFDHPKRQNVFNNASQAWNHAFYWQSLSPKKLVQPEELLKPAAQADFQKLGEDHFGSGWLWLVSEPGGRVRWHATHDAVSPLVEKLNPLLACDLWEHAYYIDYRNERKRYLEAAWTLLNWDFARENLRRG